VSYDILAYGTAYEFIAAIKCFTESL